MFFYELLLEKEPLTQMKAAQSSERPPRQVFSARNLGAQITQ
jgi:hypothetical protein